MKELKASGFTMTLSTDEYGSIHFNLSEEQGFVGTEVKEGMNKIYRMPRFGISFYAGNSISSIRQQLIRLLDFYGEEVSVSAEQFFMEFLDDTENLKFEPSSVMELVNLN